MEKHFSKKLEELKNGQKDVNAEESYLSQKLQELVEEKKKTE